LTEKDLGDIFEVLSSHFNWENDIEITLEANPDDISSEKIRHLKKFNINRLSIGLQSFSDIDLQYMNRAHSAVEAEHCIKLSQDLGLSNLSIDLIYGSPTTTDDMWQTNLDKSTSLNVPHISAYALTLEPNTPLAKMVALGKTMAPIGDTAAHQFDLLTTHLSSNGFDHYEISNFAIPEHYAIHNTNYWKGVPYLGIGPSAHSYDGQSRSWNISNNSKYINEINLYKLPNSKELLSDNDRYNEYVMTSLRTMWGIDLQNIINISPAYEAHFLKLVEPLINDQKIIYKSEKYVLSPNSLFLADGIASELFIV
jgi:oxygen-independent coproporphyrinogen III oxidase